LGIEAEPKTLFALCHRDRWPKISKPAFRQCNSCIFKNSQVTAFIPCQTGFRNKSAKSGPVYLIQKGKVRLGGTAVRDQSVTPMTDRLPNKKAALECDEWLVWVAYGSSSSDRVRP
jgi:hypothetical protein